MRRWLSALAAALLGAGAASANGLLIPTDPNTPPLAMVKHQVKVDVDEQVAVTHVTQVFRNPTDRALEATYIFPVPKGAGVNKFTMWVDGKEVSGELVEADKARNVYTEIVRRTQDPGLLEHFGDNLLRLRVFPVPARGDQKLSLSYTSVAPQDAGLVEYTYPLRADAKSVQTTEQFSLEVNLRSQHALQNIYSPTHAVEVTRPRDREARVVFEKNQVALDKDFQLFYTLGDKDVGLTALTHRPVGSGDGYFMLLISPRAELSKKQRVARDVVLVLDTSGSMMGPKMEQARKAVKFCLDGLSPRDRFAVMSFATTVNKQAEGLTEASHAQVARAKKWVGELQATGGTAIDDALRSALELRSGDLSRSFTVVFFTDGQPTIGETDPEKILKGVSGKNTANTRIFTFGVGDDVNAAMLDRLAEQTRAVSTYVRPTEDIEVKVSSLYGKVSHPVLTDLKLSAGSGVTLSEMYPNKLPDLFHGGQVVVLGRYKGHGHVALTLSGKVGKEHQTFVHEVRFPGKTKEDKTFIETLWARRKVGYLLDQIRTNGEKKELVDEVVKLAKKHGITTPYTSYLVVPDGAAVRTPVVNVPVPVPIQYAPVVPQSGPTAASASGFFLGASPVMMNQTYTQGNHAAAVRGFQATDDSVFGPGSAGYHAGSQTLAPTTQPPRGPTAAMPSAPPPPPAPGADVQQQVLAALRSGQRDAVQTGSLGVEFALQVQELRNQARVSGGSTRRAAGRTFLQTGVQWIDDGYDAKKPVLIVKAQSKAYFRILECHPEAKDVFQLGNRLIWTTPAGTNLVIDQDTGKEELTQAEIDRLFVAAK